jgi:hypothetical protein
MPAPWPPCTDPKVRCLWDDDAGGCPCDTDEPTERTIENVPTGDLL